MSMASYTLVVIDMQPHFTAANDLKAIVGCAKQIIEAKHAGSNILFVEYSLCGPTHRELTKLVKSYSNATKITKNSDDGSIEVLRALKKKRWTTKNIRVCGVNTECCVWSTIHGLLRRSSESKIEVVKEACATDGYRKYDWRTYLRDPNLKLV